MTGERAPGAAALRRLARSSGPEAPSDGRAPAAPTASRSEPDQVTVQQALLRRWWLPATGALLGLVVGLILASQVTTTYSSTVGLVVVGGSDNTAQTSGRTLASLASGVQFATTLNAGLDEPVATSARLVSDTNLVRITASSGSPGGALQGATEAARLVQEQASRLPLSTGVLGALEASVVEEPSPVRAAGGGGGQRVVGAVLAGIAVGAALAVAVARQERVVRRPEDVALAVVPTPPVLAGPRRALPWRPRRTPADVGRQVFLYTLQSTGRIRTMALCGLREPVPTSLVDDVVAAGRASGEDVHELDLRKGGSPDGAVKEHSGATQVVVLPPLMRSARALRVAQDGDAAVLVLRDGVDDLQELAQVASALRQAGVVLSAVVLLPGDSRDSRHGSHASRSSRPRPARSAD